jgi:cellulose synthase/poly-beta-1,6-N-acetylglucosamine synthase-like glycosyltransferase
MAEALFLPAALLYLAVLGALFAFGLHFLGLTWVALRADQDRTGRPEFAPDRAAVLADDDWPVVTVQLPVYNERYVAERLIDAAAKLEAPAGRLEIQVLDDSTDETVDIVAAAVARRRAAGIDIHHVRRSARVGYKAGALSHALRSAHGDYLAIFDADFVPPRDFLRRALPRLVADPGLAFVQARWGHLNRDDSVLTALQALSIDGHFAIEQFARSRSGGWFNFNGTAGIWRRAALVDAGGWSDATLTEDLDLSYRAFLRGWRAEYAGDVEVPAELPVSVAAYRRQQERWARGTFECAARHLPAIWASPVPLGRKVQATFHLTGYGIHLLMFLVSLLYPVLLALAPQHPELVTLFGMTIVFNLAVIAPTALFAAAQRRRGRRWWTALPRILLLSILGAGMMVNTLRAAWRACRARPGVFERTPKFGRDTGRDDWTRLRYQLGPDLIVVPELGLALLNAWTASVAFNRGTWAIGIYASVFAVGLGFVALLSIRQWLRTLAAAAAESGPAPRPMPGEVP